MSIVLDAASIVHQQQIDAVNRSQGLVLDVVDRIAGVAESLKSKAPSLPESLSGPVEKVNAPLVKVVGSRDDVAAYVAKSTQDWLEVQQSFQRSLVRAFAASVSVSQADVQA